MSANLMDSKKFAIDVAREAGKIMLRYFQSGEFGTEIKKDNSPVTRADLEINQMVIDRVAETFPMHTVQGEENSVMKDSDYGWVCDPIDGTVPFSKQIPIATFSLALVCNGKSILGVVYDPFGGRLIYAKKGAGAYLNNQKISVNKKQLNSTSTVNIEWWPEAQRDVVMPLHELAKKSKMYHIHLPSIVYAGMLVATGKIEACIFPGTKGKNVDIAALKIIVEEAGGCVTDLDGNEQRYDQDINGAVISNRVVHANIITALQ